MATKEEKLELAVVSELLEGVANVLKSQIPAIRDSGVQRRVAAAQGWVLKAKEKVDGVIGE